LYLYEKNKVESKRKTGRSGKKVGGSFTARLEGGQREEGASIRRCQIA